MNGPSAEDDRYGFLSGDGYPEEGPNPLIKPMPTAENDAPTICCGALPPYSVTYIDPEVCATSHDQWFVMGTVDGDPGNGQGPVAICEYEPSAHVIAALLNASGGCVIPPASGDAR